MDSTRWKSRRPLHCRRAMLVSFRGHLSHLVHFGWNAIRWSCSIPPVLRELGFRVGGLIGANFLKGYRVSFDLVRDLLRLRHAKGLI